MVIKLSEICTCESKTTSGKEFVGIRCEKDKDGVLKTQIFFPFGYFKDDDSLRQIKEDKLREHVFDLFSVLSDESLLKNHNDSTLFYLEENETESNFPMTSYLNVIRNYLDCGYITEKEFFYKKGIHGKVCWRRTIREIRPIISESDRNLIYPDLITRKVSYNEECLISLVHKFCVHDALSRLGFLFGVEPTEEPRLKFSYDMFLNVINAKLAKTFNDRDLHLLSDLTKIVEYLARHSVKNGENANGFYYGVDKFAPLWEGMINRIFGTVADKSEYNPHLKFVAEQTAAQNGVEYQEKVDPSAEYKRSTLRPDSIMIKDHGVFILDSKYYKFGKLGEKTDLPGAESVCKQMAYAEYVRKKLDPMTPLEKKDHTTNMWKSMRAAGVTPNKIFNAFIMPYCANGTEALFPNAKFADNNFFGMCRVGHVYGDWKNVSRTVLKDHPYHKIHCILLDMKSVMQNYERNSDAQDELSKLIKD